MVTSGAPVLAKEALVAGLVDELAPEDGLRDAAVAFARKAADQGRPLRRVRDQDEKLQSAKGQPELFSDFRKANARKFRGFEAPEANIACIQAAVDMPFDEGLAFERERFLMLMAGSQSAAQRYYFFAEAPGRQDPRRGGRHGHDPAEEGGRDRRRHHGRRHRHELRQRGHPRHHR